MIINKELISKKEFWRSSFPKLHIEDVGFINENLNFQVTQEITNTLKEKIKKEGYFQIDPPNWETTNISQMAETVSELVKLGFPTPMAFLFDEFWVVFQKLNNIAVSILGEGYLRLPDFWAWHLDPQKNQSGWGPHRDKNFKALYPDGMPKALTFWISLSISTPLNGCMYIVPANKDRSYGTENDTKWDFDLQSIRALPAEAGSIFCWNQAVLHWGSQCSDSEKTPRVAVAMEFQSGDIEPYNQPLMDPTSIPNFEFRLRLITKQILQYQHMYPLSDTLKEFAEKILCCELN
jgi:hypothetical protein